MAMQSAFSQSFSPLGPTSAQFLPSYKRTDARINRRQSWKSDEGECKPVKSSPYLFIPQTNDFICHLFVEKVSKAGQMFVKFDVSY